MPRFAANLSLMYTELPFAQRFEAAARDGFRAAEFLFPYEFPAAELAAAPGVRDGVDASPVEPCPERRTERRLHRMTVGAVGLEDRRGRRIARG